MSGTLTSITSYGEELELPDGSNLPVTSSEPLPLGTMLAISPADSINDPRLLNFVGATDTGEPIFVQGQPVTFNPVSGTPLIGTAEVFEYTEPPFDTETPGNVPVGVASYLGNPPAPTKETLADIANGIYGALTSTPAGPSLPAPIDGYSIAQLPSGTLETTGPNTTGYVGGALLGPGTPNGFFGAAFQNGTDQLVVAFRGTDVGNLNNFVDNLLSDASWATGVPNPVLTDNVTQAADFLAQVEMDFPGMHITLTGHSLGGAIAQLVAQAAGLPSIVFNAPGAAGMETNLQNALAFGALTDTSQTPAPSTNYRVAGDQVSLAGDPIGTQVTLPSTNPDNWANAPNNHSMLEVIKDIDQTPVAQEPALSYVSLAAQLGAGLVVGVATNFVPFIVSSLISQFGLDPSGGASTFEIDVAAGSPAIGTVALPIVSGIANYALDFETASGAGTVQTVMPGQIVTATAGTTGFQFEALDANNQPVMLTDPGLVNVTFAALGTVQASITALATNLTAATTPMPTGTAPLGPPNNFLVQDTTNGGSWESQGTVYSGPVTGLSDEVIFTTTDSLNITAQTPNVFIHTGSGSDAIDVSSVNGNNVLDGSTGSNYMTGGTGDDQFYVDDRGPTSDIWTTIVGMHAGDSATVWGLIPADVINEGNNVLPTSPGLTFSIPGTPNVNLTIQGYSTADLSGHLAMSFGTSPNEPGLAGSPYMLIQAS